MAYTPNTWNVGDKITKAKLDRLESAAAGALDQEDAAATYAPIVTDAETRTDVAPIAVPSGDLAFTLAGQYAAVVTSIGVDGIAYGYQASTYLIRTVDGLATTESGPNLASLHSGATIAYATKTTAGFLVITDKGTDSTGEAKIWLAAGQAYSSSLTFRLMATIRGVTSNLLSISDLTLGPDGKTVMTVGEYGGGYSFVRKLWLTRDGGVSWDAIRSIGPGSDTSKASHFHRCTHDPVRNRLWASHGDGGNRGFEYSDDWGATWKTVTVPTTSDMYVSDSPAGNLQPVAVVVVEDRVYLSPDEGTLVSGIFELDASTPEKIVRRFTLASGELGWRQFGHAVVAHRGREIYMTFPYINGGTLKTYFVGSGDGGRSWTQLYTLNWAGASGGQNGVVGPDRNGVIYHATFNSTEFGAGVRTIVAPPVQWTWRTA